MNRDQFGESMKRIIGAFPLRGAEAEAYLASVFETCQRWPAYEFDQVTKRVVETQKMGRPKPADYIAAYKALSTEQGWGYRREVAAVCERCEGTRWVYTGVMHKATRREWTAVKPCPHCSHGRVQLQPSPDYEECPDPAVDDLLAQAAMFTPKGARSALDKTLPGLTLREDVAAILRERADAPDPERPSIKCLSWPRCPARAKCIQGPGVEEAPDGGGSETPATYSAQATTRTAPTNIRRIQG